MLFTSICSLTLQSHSFCEGYSSHFSLFNLYPFVLLVRLVIIFHLLDRIFQTLLREVRHALHDTRTNGRLTLYCSARVDVTQVRFRVCEKKTYQADNGSIKSMICAFEIPHFFILNEAWFLSRSLANVLMKQQ